MYTVYDSVRSCRVEIRGMCDDVWLWLLQGRYPFDGKVRHVGFPHRNRALLLVLKRSGASLVIIESYRTSGEGGSSLDLRWYSTH